jgi:hypothetical protein
MARSLSVAIQRMTLWGQIRAEQDRDIAVIGKEFIDATVLRVDSGLDYMGG